MKPGTPAAEPTMFEAALNALDSAVIVHGSDTIMFANAAASRVLRAGCAEALIGRPITSIVHPDGREAGHERRRLVLEQGQTMQNLPVKLRAFDGEPLYLRVHARRIEWEGGAAILIITTPSDRWPALTPRPHLATLEPR